ncbi:YegP family protein [Enterovirga sp.]|uniref:YegP family protein n=1 Tax=Enterovirga sp. TaxID=2026350 RepID=UPI002608A47B|nr:YegP family protein [Enterovirga sp.]MDB5591478.1 hypothetical protein [Enterovirga sp.]
MPKPTSFPCYHKSKDNRGEWRWTYYARNGEEIGVSSESYKEERDCDRGIEIMKSSKDSPVTK